MVWLWNIFYDRNTFNNNQKSVYTSPLTRLKAVDVLVRMFEPFVTNKPELSEVKMLVLGSTHPRMGDASKKYTMESLVAANSKVVKLTEEISTWR